MSGHKKSISGIKRLAANMSKKEFLIKHKSDLFAMMKNVPSNNRPEIAACGQKKTSTSHLGKFGVGENSEQKL